MTLSQHLIRSAANHRKLDLEIHRLNGTPIASQIANAFVLALAGIALIALCGGLFGAAFVADQIMEGMNNV